MGGEWRRREKEREEGWRRRERSIWGMDNGGCSFAFWSLLFWGRRREDWRRRGEKGNSVKIELIQERGTLKDEKRVSGISSKIERNHENI